MMTNDEISKNAKDLPIFIATLRHFWKFPKYTDL